MVVMNLHERTVSAPPANGAALIRLSQVSKEYPTPAGPFHALQDVSLEIQPGEFVAVVGKSGAGKTTLVNMITGIDHATRGEVVVAGVRLDEMDEARLSQWRGVNMGVIYQSFHLLPGLSLLDNVLLPMDFCQLYKRRESQERAMELLRQVGLEEHARKHPAEISGGQQQRVAIARALANDPAMIMADEPTGRLDSLTAEGIFNVFEELVEQGKTIIMVTHDQGLARRVPRRLQIVDGKVAAYGD